MKPTPWTKRQLKEVLDLNNQQNFLAEKYGVSAATIANTRRKYGVVASKRSITQEQRDLLLSSYDCASLAQLAKFTGMSKSQVVREIHKFKSQGVITKRQLFNIAPQMLVAKTCTSCGNLLSANWFYKMTKNGRKYWNSKCKRCDNDSTIEKRRNSNSISHYNYMSVMRRMTLPLAVNKGQPLSDEDHEVLADKTKSTLQKALELGRTYDAVGGAISRFGYSGKNTCNKLPDPTIDVWIIKFPNAMKELQEYYKRLGPVPEAYWDWNDVA